MNWAPKYIGLPFEAGARGPARVDCWGLVCLVYAMEFNIILPTIAGADVANYNPRMVQNVLLHEASLEWEAVERPVEGCVVAMSQSRVMHHVGLYTEADGGLIVHAREGQNTVADTLRGLTLKGLNIQKFYKHKQWPG